MIIHDLLNLSTIFFSLSTAFLLSPDTFSSIVRTPTCVIRRDELYLNRWDRDFIPFPLYIAV